MRRIIYRSVARGGLDRVELFRLVYHARVGNQARGLCGFLVQVDQRLLQVLEGPTWKLVATFEAIRRDPRHGDVAVLDERSIMACSFARWPMRYFDDRDIPRMLREIAQGADGPVPGVVQDALLDFLGPDLTRPGSVRTGAAGTPLISPALPEAGLPSSSTRC